MDEMDLIDSWIPQHEVHLFLRQKTDLDSGVGKIPLWGKINPKEKLIHAFTQETALPGLKVIGYFTPEDDSDVPTKELRVFRHSTGLAAFWPDADFMVPVIIHEARDPSGL